MSKLDEIVNEELEALTEQVYILRAENERLRAFLDTKSYDGFEDWWGKKRSGGASIKDLANIAFIAGSNSEVKER